MISATPTNGAMSNGKGMPIFKKRPTPSASGNKFLNRLGKKNPTDQDANEQDRLCCAIRQARSVFGVMEDLHRAGFELNLHT
jgi:hypothetical protein